MPPAPRTRHRTALIATSIVLILLGSLIPSPANAFWSVSTVSPSSGAASAATVNQGATPTATVATQNDITVSWAASTLSNGVAVSGYTVTRYDAADVAQIILAGCAGTRTTLSCTETNVPDGLWTYAITPRLATNWVGVISARSAEVRSDATAPVNAISRVSVSGNSIKNGDTVFYRGAAAGSFRLSNAVTDTGSRPASSATEPLSGTTAGWSHSPSSVSTPAGGPFQSAPFSWAAGTTAEPAVGVTGTDVAGNTAATTIQFRRDDTPPTGGAISYATGTYRQSNILLTVQPVSDAGAGVVGGTRTISYRLASLSGDTCGNFGSPIFLVTNPAEAPAGTNATINSTTCVQFDYVFTDSVGNTTTARGGVTKFKPSYQSVITGTGGLVDYYRLGDASTPIVDSQGGNNGTSVTPPSLGGAGAIAADTNTSASFDGANDYIRTSRTISDDFSIEFWFKSTQGFGTSAQWWTGAGLVDAEVPGVANDFGVSLSSDGRVMAGVGNPDTTASSSGGFNDNQWHHVVMTRTRATGAVVLYVDGVQRSTVTGNTLSLTGPANIDFGRLQAGVNYYQGSLDEVALYNTALTAAQVKSHFDNAIP